VHPGWYDQRTRRVRDLPSGPYRIYLEFEVRRVDCKNCQAVKREALDFLSDSPFYTKRFAYLRGPALPELDDLERRQGTVPGLGQRQDVGQAVHEGAAGQGRNARAKRIGIDEMSIKKRHTYRIVVSDLDRRFIKGQEYTLLSNRENLTLEGCQALKQLLAANKRLDTAYLLKESFGRLWSYRSAAWTRRFFENWRAALKWQRLKPYEKFAEMIERHWDGIVAYCHPGNKVSLGFVEGRDNKIRVIQRRAYGSRDEENLRLKILTCMLPRL
jgi:transposase